MKHLQNESNLTRNNKNFVWLSNKSNLTCIYSTDLWPSAPLVSSSGCFSICCRRCRCRCLCLCLWGISGSDWSLQFPAGFSSSLFGLCNPDAVVQADQSRSDTHGPSCCFCPSTPLWHLLNDKLWFWGFCRAAGQTPPLNPPPPGGLRGQQTTTSAVQTAAVYNNFHELLWSCRETWRTRSDQQVTGDTNRKWNQVFKVLEMIRVLMLLWFFVHVVLHSNDWSQSWTAVYCFSLWRHIYGCTIWREISDENMISVNMFVFGSVL